MIAKGVGMKRVSKMLIGGLLMSLPLNINAISLTNIKDIKCTMTEEYKNFLNLSEEKRKNVIVPVMCEEFKANTKYGITIEEPDYVDASKFDLRNVAGKNYVTSVKNQMLTGTCWAHSLASSIESNYMMKDGKEINISELALGYASSYQLKDGINPYGVLLYSDSDSDVVPLDTIENGNTFGGIMSLVGARRSILTEDKSGLVINETITDSSSGLLEYLKLKSEYVVNDLYLSSANTCQENNNYEINIIKNMLVYNGTVYGGTYVDKDFEGFTDDSKNYYYTGEEIQNHAISIVGWDDEYSKDNFINENGANPSGDGAFIIKNSYGTDFGDNGYYYISYYDKNICSINFSVDRVKENQDDYSYFYDLLTVPVSLKFNDLYLANKFVKNDDNVELLKNISLFAMNPGDKYELYYSKDLSTSNYKLLTKGTFKFMGITNIDIDSKINVDDEFYIILKYISQNGVPVGLFATNNSNPQIITGLSAPIYTDPKIGVSYYSEDAKNWADSVNEGLNLCVKQEDCQSEENNVLINFNPIIYAFTIAESYRFDIDSIDNNLKNNVDGGHIKYNLSIENIDKTKIDVKILNSKLEDVTNQFKIINDINEYTIIAESNKVSIDNYKIVFTYDGIELTDEFTVSKKEPTIQSIEIVGEDTVYANGKLVLTVKVNSSSNINPEIKWESSDTNIATVENGIVSGITQGEVIITARTTDGSNKIATKKILVKGVQNTIINDNTNNGNVGESSSNPKTGIESYYLIFIVVILAAANVYLYINKKKIFHKI